MEITVIPNITYVATGSTKSYTFPFDYLRKAFVKVKIDGEPTSAYILEGKTITFDTPPAQGSFIYIYRDTSTTRLVSWQDASVLKAKDMTIQQVQELHILEEEDTRFQGIENRVDIVVGNVEELAEQVAKDSATAQNAANVSINAKDVAVEKAEYVTENLDAFTEDIEQLKVDKFDKSDVPYVTPAKFGAVGDGVTDDTNALRLALKHSSDNKIPLMLPPKKRYLVTDTLNKIDGVYVGLTFNIIGYNSSGNYNTANGGIQVANNVDLFRDASFTGKIEKICISGTRSGGSNVFRDSTLSTIYFSQNYISNFDNFGLGLSIHSTSKIIANKFVSVFNFLDIDTENNYASGIIDSTIRDNYINGGKEPTDNVCFGIQDGNGSIITNNFVDYFNTVFCCKSTKDVVWCPPVSIGNHYQVFRYFFRIDNTISTYFQSVSDCFNWTNVTASATADVLPRYKKYTYTGRDGNVYDYPEYIARPVAAGQVEILNAKIERNIGNVLYLVGGYTQYVYSRFKFTVASCECWSDINSKVALQQGSDSPNYNGGAYPYLQQYESDVYRKVDALPYLNVGWSDALIGEKVLYGKTLYQAKCYNNGTSNIAKWIPIQTTDIYLSGNTASRPTVGLTAGLSYFDTSLNKPIWYKGSNVWVDATGTTV